MLNSQNNPAENELYADLIKWLAPQGYSFFKIMPDGSLSALNKFIFTTGLVTHVEWHTPYKRRWCYEHLGDAISALSLYTGEGDPSGPWLKYKGQGPERHNPHMYEKDRHGIFRRLPNEKLKAEALWPGLSQPI